jgi:hypothetical protein
VVLRSVHAWLAIALGVLANGACSSLDVLLPDGQDAAEVVDPIQADATPDRGDAADSGDAKVLDSTRVDVSLDAGSDGPSRSDATDSGDADVADTSLDADGDGPSRSDAADSSDADVADTSLGADGDGPGAAPACDADLATDPNNCGACGHICVAQTCDGSVCVGTTGFPPALTSYFDGTLEHVLYLDVNGQVDDLSGFQGAGWASQPVTAPRLSVGAFLAGSNITAAWDGSNIHVFYLGASVSGTSPTADLFVSEGSSPSLSNGSTTDLTIALKSNPSTLGVTSKFAANNIWNMVNAPATLTSIWAYPVVSVFYAGADSCVHVAVGLGFAWSGAEDQCIKAGNPVSTSKAIYGAYMASLWDGEEAHVYYTGGNELYYFNQQWWQGSPPGTLGGYLSASATGATEHLFGSASFASNFVTDLKVSDPSVPPSADFSCSTDASAATGWCTTPVAMEAGAASCDVSSPTVTYLAGTQTVYFCTASDGAILQYTAAGTSAGVTAIQLDVPAEIDTTTEPQYSPVSGFYDGDNLHVFYIGADGHVHEAYSPDGQSWATNDLTGLASAPDAAH